MATKINFDITNKPEIPTLILANKSGNKIGKINAQDIVIIGSLNDADEISFKVYKYLNGVKDILWDKIKDFKLVYCKENDLWYEITVNLNESNEIFKNVECKQLAYAELSQINVYNLEVNTDIDIERDDYKPTILFNEHDESCSLLHRIFNDKAKHYHIVHVDSTIADIQKTFNWDNTDIMSICNDISKEIHCLFKFNYDFDGDNNVCRTVAVYDLESNCINCGYRGEFTGICPECGSNNINEGYGEDTNIFITADELGNDIQYSTDTGSVKNCFKLETGDDLMTATVRNCNPNGSDYIWYISDDTKEDMSDELVTKLNDYDEMYSYYQNDYTIPINAELLSKYNTLITKYKPFNNNLEYIQTPVVGYPALMTAFYKTVDLIIYLQSEMLPTIEMSETNAVEQAELLTANNLSPVSISKVEAISQATANNAVLAVAKCIINTNYQVKVNTSSLIENTWVGNFQVTHYSNEEDTATSSTISITLNDNYENYVYQKIQKILAKDVKGSTDVTDLFAMDLVDFKNELKNYCLDNLNKLYDICQSCIDVLIEQGVADKESWDGKSPNLYDNLYYPYRRKLEAIQDEQKIRENEIAIVLGVYDNEGEIVEQGLQNVLNYEKTVIQTTLNFENYLGETLWLEFCAYRRDDKYTNSNYISDGLNNTELFNKANEFIEVAKKELKKSAELQHSISTKLINLLIIPKFQSLVDKFDVGNWLRIAIDDKVYKLRLLQYQIVYKDLNNIYVVFSDVMKIPSGSSDIQSILNQASSMASSYDTIQKQASQGAESKIRLDNWVTNGLALTNMKIIGNADNQDITWDSHGILGKEYIPITGDYSDKQIKFINKGIYLTDDNWETAKTGIGEFNYYDPQDGQYKEGYGIIADTIVGNFILSEKVGIYNTENSIILDKNGFIITTDNTEDDIVKTAFSIQRKELDENEDEQITQLLYINSDGDLILNGSIKINSSADENTITLNELADASRFSDKINETIYNMLNTNEENITVFATDENGNMIFDVDGYPVTQEMSVSGLYSKIDAQYNNSVAYSQYMLNKYQSEVSQYMSFDNETGLTLGATNSQFKTVIDNTRMAFYDNNTVAAYISNQQLHIPNAVIEKTLTLGNFFFAPRSDGGVSITWQS